MNVSKTRRLPLWRCLCYLYKLLQVPTWTDARASPVDDAATVVRIFDFPLARVFCRPLTSFRPFSCPSNAANATRTTHIRTTYITTHYAHSLYAGYRSRSAAHHYTAEVSLFRPLTLPAPGPVARHRHADIGGHHLLHFRRQRHENGGHHDSRGAHIIILRTAAHTFLSAAVHARYNIVRRNQTGLM